MQLRHRMAAEAFHRLRWAVGLTLELTAGARDNHLKASSAGCPNIEQPPSTLTSQWRHREI